MPIHAWSAAPPGLFHHFQQRWSVAICDSLNDGRLPDDCFALLEQNTAGLYQDVLTLQSGAVEPRTGGLAVADSPPRARFVQRASEEGTYATKANRVVVRNSAGRIIAVIELVSPGNKNTRSALRSFVDKAVDLIGQGVNLMVVDLFPPSPRDPQGLHPLIWGEIEEEPLELPADKPLTIASYAAGVPVTAYVEPVAVGDPLPEMVLFLDPDTYVLVPLEPSYQETWSRCPRQFRQAVTGGGQ
jgi:hypothetical protein